jgi:hypothetical protein
MSSPETHPGSPVPAPILAPVATASVEADHANPDQADAALPGAAPATALPTLEGEIDTARRYAEAAHAASTRRAYASDWRRFTAWCSARGLETLPADPRSVAVFLAAEAGAAPPTIGRRLAAIGWMHRRAGLPPPQTRPGATAITEVLTGIRRSHGVAPARKHAADADWLHDVLRGIPGSDLRSRRDRALLAFGMAGAFRRSELVALRLADIDWSMPACASPSAAARPTRRAPVRSSPSPRAADCDRRRCSLPGSPPPGSATASCSAASPASAWRAAVPKVPLRL